MGWQTILALCVMIPVFIIAPAVVWLLKMGFFTALKKIFFKSGS
jgi:hypothetical protein